MEKRQDEISVDENICLRTTRCLAIC